MFIAYVVTKSKPEERMLCRRTGSEWLNAVAKTLSTYGIPNSLNCICYSHQQGGGRRSDSPLQASTPRHDDARGGAAKETKSEEAPRQRAREGALCRRREGGGQESARSAAP